ncbi:putative RNA-directed DNA polymerase from transposon BS [Trichonephila clavipes]|nr:putative RNA-directed DNA polymerase from transposon BS [Trichonephila clavipes]
MSRWMLGKQQRPWLSITQMKVGLLLVVTTSTPPESPEINSALDLKLSKSPKFCVNFHATFSDSCKTYQGIPQGCILSPILFSLFISGVEKYVNPSQIGLLADDVVLWCIDANISKMESQLNRSLVNIQEFADNHKITSNASKSTVSLFTTNKHLYNYSPENFLMSERLNYSKYPTYLGFTLDSEVNCGKHIEEIADKAERYLRF